MLSNQPAYTILETCELARVSRGTVYAEIKAKRLCARKIGARTVILEEDLAQWLRNLKPLGADNTPPSEAEVAQ